MASEKNSNTTEEDKSSVKSSAYSGQHDTAQQVNQAKSKTGGAVKRAVRCPDCGKKFDDWRLLQRHKRKSCLKSSWRFMCRECKAYFPSKIELNNHISVAHVTQFSEKAQKSKNTCSTGNNGSGTRKKVKGNSLSTSEKKDSHHVLRLKWKKAHKHRRNKSDVLKNRKCASSRKKMAKRVGKSRKRVADMKLEELEKPVVEICTVGCNPFPFTTSCSPDAPSFHFLCQSCLTVRFATYSELRQHEDWCARVRNSQGFVCLPCGRHYRNLGTLRRHADEYHKMPVLSEAKKTVVNPYLFSTTIAMDAGSHPHVCSSCRVVCFIDPAALRRHEDWCGQCVSAKDGFKCEKCGRYFRSAALLDRHTVADYCSTTESFGMAVNVLKMNCGTETETLGSDVKQEAGVVFHSVCPLCDVPFMSQYEQQVHFLHVHQLTSSELKVKQAVQRHSRRGFVGLQVTCLDCDMTFSSRLELVQHKRICTKKKDTTKLVQPTTPPMESAPDPSDDDQSDFKSTRSVKDGNSSRKVGGPGGGTETKTSTSGKSATHERQRKGKRSELLSNGAVNKAGMQRLEISQGLLLNTTKVRNLIRTTGAKQLLLKPDGELILLGDNGEKISTINGKISVDNEHVEIHSSCIKNDVKPGSFEKPSSQHVDQKLLMASLGSGQSTVGNKTVDYSLAVKTGKCVNNEDLKPTAEDLELLSSKKNSGQTEAHLQPKRCKIEQNSNDQRQIRQCPKKVARHKSAEAESASAMTTRSDGGKWRKSTRKRSLEKEEPDVSDSDQKRRDDSAHSVEVKNGVVTKESVSRSTRSMRSPDTVNHSVFPAEDLSVPASAAREIKVSDSESSCKVTDGQQMLLEALQLVPVSSRLNRPQTTTTARYRTRASTHVLSNSGESRALKKSRSAHSGKDLSKSSTSSGAKRLESSAEIASNTNETAEVTKCQSTNTQQISNGSLPQKTWTVETAGDGLVRCVACETVFRTVQQIVDHICTE